MKKRVIIISSISIVIFVVVAIIIAVTISRNSKMSESEWKSILNQFNKYESITIKYSDNENEYKILKNKDNYTYIHIDNGTESETLHFEANTFKFYNDNGWKKIECKDEYPISINYNVSNYISLYNSFSYDKKDKCYYINDYNDYVRIELYFDNNELIKYKLIDDSTISYEFSNHNQTTVKFPINYDRVYKVLEKVDWEKIISDTAEVKEYDFVSLYSKKKDNEIVFEQSNIGKCRANEVELTTNSKKTKYVLNGEKWDYYEMNNNQYDYVNSLDKELINFNQKTSLPYDFLMESYDNLIFNEFANSYEINNYVYDDIIYKDVIINISNERISYISMIYTVIEENIQYEITEIISFTFIN